MMITRSKKRKAMTTTINLMQSKMMITCSKRRKAMTTTINPTAYLSQDLIFFHILPRLPAKSLFKFTCVSKLWNKMIHDPNLIASHYNHSKSNHSLVAISGTLRRIRFMYLGQGGGEGDQEEGASSVIVSLRNRHWKRLVGYINGLTCFRMRFSIGICNPTTHEMLHIPFPIRVGWTFVNYGFGFDPSVNEYKILLIGNPVSKIYTVGAGLNSTQDCIWRDITVPSTLQREWNEAELKSFPPPFICSSGALFKVIPRRNIIVIFDIHYEKFQVIPGLLCRDQLRLYSISEFRECPYAVYYTVLEDGYEFRIYALKQQQQHQSSNSSWLIKECSYRIIHFVFQQAVHIPFKPPSNLIRFVEISGQILMLWISSLDGHIYVYNPHKKTLRKELSGLCSWWYIWNSVLFVRQVDNLHSLKTLVPLLPLGAPQVKYLSSRETHVEENSAKECHPFLVELC